MIKMDRGKLEAYRSMTAEIAELQDKLENLKDDENLIDADTVLDYHTGHGIPRSIVGVNHNRYWRKRQKYYNRIKELQAECDQIEEWVEQIQDSMTRRIFRMVYIDGMLQKEAGRILHIDRSRISQKISDYLTNNKS